MSSFFCHLLVLIVLSFTLSLESSHAFMGKFAWGKERKVVDIDTKAQVSPYVDMNLNWMSLATSDKERVRILFQFLQTTKVGKDLIEKAKVKAYQQNEKLEEIIFPGDGSTADTTLVRRFYPETPHEVTYEIFYKVYINKNLSLSDAILDLAHELGHYTYRGPFNPYQGLNLKDFIVSTVEGVGGEVDAYLIECSVMKELFSKNVQKSSNCARLVDYSGNYSRDLAIKKFYQVGSYYEEFMRELKKYSIDAKDLSKVSKEYSVYISSAYEVPYPLAAVKEYTSIMKKVCLNDEKRLSLMVSKNERNPASEESISHYRKHLERCSSFL